MKKVVIALFFVLYFFSLTRITFASSVSQTSPKDIFYQATVTSLMPSKKVLEATVNGKNVQVTYEPQSSGTIYSNDTIVIAQTGIDRTHYYFVDVYRVSSLLFVVLGFFLFILLIVGWKGIGSITGLLISLGVIFVYIVPQIIAGQDPLTVCMIGAVGILFVTTFIAHGISRQTITALVATFFALLIAYFLAQFVAYFVMLTGYGNEDAVNLQFALPHMLNLKGLFLGGIILATLGALNDMTITQAASIFALRKSNVALTFKNLALEGYAIGREHALSLINTLVLAFAGTSLALFIFILANPNREPLWVILNSEFIIEEVLKIIIGTAGLLLAVPLVTLLAALACDKEMNAYVRSFFK